MLVCDSVTLFTPETSVLILGIAWHPQDDCFRFHVEDVTIEKPISKCNILSRIARTFDPLGWMAPVVIRAKILIQSLWLLKVGWADELPIEISNSWSDWVEELPLVSKIKIPRWTGFTPNTKLIEIHGFADASKQAYGAVVYLRIVRESRVFVSMQVAKTRVAPVKTLSIPRLELCATVLLTLLVKQFVDSARIELQGIHLSTDSADVLFWLRDHPSRWGVFVANRCSEIHTSLPQTFWHHLRSRDNPADVITRGIDPSKLESHDFWWNGPNCLREITAPWSQSHDELNFASSSVSRSSENLACNVIAQSLDQQAPIWDLVERYSELNKLLRITAYCIRFVTRIKSRIIEQKNPNFQALNLPFFKVIGDPGSELQAEELNNAQFLWCHLIQRAAFGNEFERLQKNLGLSSKNPLPSLNPVIQDQLIKVGGRLAYAQIEDSAKYPIIMPHSNSFVTLLIRHAHKQTLHGGTQLTLATLRRQFWIIRGRTEVKRVIRLCAVCARYAVQIPNQLMGELPSARVRPCSAFEKAGVDYAGPIRVRLTKSRGKGTLKAYICVFVCMATRAVHLEAVEDYTIESFIATFHRFVARRGDCKELFSDQGTNFVGAYPQLKEMLSEASEFYIKVSRTMANEGTTWKFNPPSAPHFGGLWESAVKLIKHHVRRVIGEQVLTFSELCTLLCRVEACLNSRPLSVLSDDPTDLNFLSPAHLLILRPSFLIPEPGVSCVNIPVGKRWQIMSQMVQHFWARWSEEYLSALQSRKKRLTLRRVVTSCKVAPASTSPLCAALDSTSRSDVT